MIRRVWLSVALLTALLAEPAFAGIARADSAFQRFLGNLQFVPQYYLSTDLSGFALHQNAFYKRQYLGEWTTGLGITFLTFRDRLSSVWDIDFHIGLGEVPGNVVFSVLAADFGIQPGLELRLRRTFLDAGLSHRCFHEVDRTDLQIVHWNELYLKLESQNSRINRYWPPMGIDKKWTQADRFAWEMRGGYFLKEFFGLASPNKLNGRNPREAQAVASARYAFYHRRSWVVVATGSTMLGFTDDSTGKTFSDRLFWREDFGAEAYFNRGKRGALMYVKYTLDDLPLIEGKPRFGKDGLLQFGVRFFS